MNKVFSVGLAGFAFVAAAACDAAAQLPIAPQTYGVKTMSFDSWCQENQRLPAERCKQRRPDDLKAFDSYRTVVERYELQYLKKAQRDRDAIDNSTRDINRTVLDKAIGIR